MTRVVHLHIGAPKTGTTYVQDRLSRNAGELAKHGVHYPGRGLGDPYTFHIRAARDLLGQDWGGSPGHAQGAWDQMVRRARRARGDVVISHEILAPASAEKVARAMRDLRDFEVHLVYSVRDLGRQLPAAWQESIKQGRTWSFARFLDRTERGNAWFARAFDLPSVLNTWGRNLPPDQVHVVTVPRTNLEEPDLLWHRFCRSMRIDPAWAPVDSTRSNQSLGTVETQLIRQLNRRMGRAVRRDTEYDELVLGVLAREQLSLHRRSAKVTLPPDRYDWAEEQGRLWVDWVRGSGVDLIGELDELLPQRPDPEARWANPDKVRPRPMLRASLDALEVMTREAASRPVTLGHRVRRRLGRADDG